MRMKGIVPQVRQFTIAIQPILASLLVIGWLDDRYDDDVQFVHHCERRFQ
jgi:hypothetical protein